MMTLNLSSPSESVNPIARSSLPGRVVLVMQGGGAPGSYQAGAYQALHEAGIEPDWVVGTSIGAINGAIIAGNAASDRIKRLKEFWERLDPRLPEPWNQVSPLVSGVPSFFYPNPALAWGIDARVGIEQAAMYLVEPLRKLLPTLVDFNLVNSGNIRFTLGLTKVGIGRDAVLRQQPGDNCPRARTWFKCRSTLLSRCTGRRRVLLGRRRLFKFTDRGGF